MNNLNKENVTAISALLVHAAKIDEIYTDQEKKLIKNFIKSYLKNEEINETLKKLKKLKTILINCLILQILLKKNQWILKRIL
jgi:ribosomal protein L17